MCSFVVPDAKQFGIKKIQVDEQIGMIWQTPPTPPAHPFPGMGHNVSAAGSCRTAAIKDNRNPGDNLLILTRIRQDQKIYQ